MLILTANPQPKPRAGPPLFVSSAFAVFGEKGGGEKGREETKGRHAALKHPWIFLGLPTKPEVLLNLDTTTSWREKREPVHRHSANYRCCFVLDVRTRRSGVSGSASRSTPVLGRLPLQMRPSLVMACLQMSQLLAFLNGFSLKVCVWTPSSSSGCVKKREEDRWWINVRNTADIQTCVCGGGV